MGVPFGSHARLILLYLQTEALRTGSREVELGRSLRDWLGRIGVNSPWGLAIAPSDFGKFAGDLLVGNFGDGRISAFDLKHDDKFVGQLTGIDGKPTTIGDLWALTPGNGGSAGSTGEVYFTAGVQGESQGLFGSISPVLGTDRFMVS